MNTAPDEIFTVLKDMNAAPSIRVTGQKSKTLDYAVAELSKYLNLVYNIDFNILYSKQADENSSIILVNEDNGSLNKKENDEFSISVKDGNLYILGSNGRSVLYGVYRFIEEYVGIKWVNPEYEHIPQTAPDNFKVNSKVYKPSFSKRGLVLENSQSSEYIIKIIDWMTRNYYNSIFFTFHLWEEYKDILRDEVEKRGLLLTLGGHNIDLFIPSGKYFINNPDWFSLYNGVRIDTQPCFTNLEGTNTIINNIIDYCANEKVISTVCIWPNDNLYICKCVKCEEKGFITSYIEFLDRLREEMNKKGLNINIQHIAYNAQLEWDMLDTLPDENTLDTLIACWGRDYSKGMHNPSNDDDKRFKKAFETWADLCNNKFHTGLEVFEYYGDYWMLTGLFPPLLKTISEDVEFFKEIGIHEVTSLIVPHYLPDKIVYEELLKEELPEDAANREYNSETSVLWFNLYAFGCKIWDCTVSEQQIMDDYCSTLFGPNAQTGKCILNSLERNLSGLSEYNIKFFSLNFKLLWLRDNWMKNKAVSKKGSSEIVHWSPDADDIWIPDSRIDTSLKILKDIGENQLQQEFEEDNNKKRYANILELKGYYDFIQKKIQSICFQSTAQQCVIKGNADEAFNNLSEALKLEDSINGWDKAECLKWINKLKGGIEK